MSDRKRILTGDRPTGRLHLGHYVGSLRNRVRLQDEYECYFIIADLHMLTTKNSREDIDATADNARGMVLDYLSAGIDPAKSTIFLQSAVHETYELALLFGNLVTVPRLARLPSIKDMARAALLDEETIPLGLLGYPVLQAADILLPRAHLVPVGKDNQAHVEITREIAAPLQQSLRRGLPDPRRPGAGRHAARHRRPGQDEQVARQRHPALGRRQDGAEESSGDVHRPEPHPRRHPGHGRRQPGLHLSRSLRPGSGRRGRAQGALPSRHRGRRGGERAADGRPQRLPRPDA